MITLSPQNERSPEFRVVGLRLVKKVGFQLKFEEGIHLRNPEGGGHSISAWEIGRNKDLTVPSIMTFFDKINHLLISY